jgi:hypothetical protein
MEFTLSLGLKRHQLSYCSAADSYGIISTLWLECLNVYTTKSVPHRDPGATTVREFIIVIEHLPAFHKHNQCRYYSEGKRTEVLTVQCLGWKT